MDRVKRYLFPEVDPEVQRNIDEESLRNIYRLSFVVMLFELFTIVLFLLAVRHLDPDMWISLGSVLFCALVCLIGFLVSGWMLRQGRFSAGTVKALRITYFLILSAWAVFVSCRQYLRGEQLLTFFAVELTMVCFVPLRPTVSIILQTGVYVGLYAALFRLDGAQGLNILNYLVLLLVSIAGMIVRFRSQVHMAERAVMLKKSNTLLEYSNRHDALTALLNRTALDEDIPRITGRHVTARMVDINYFKEINDMYGHVAGDAVLREAGARLKALFPVSFCYRYGGDEFLVLSPEEEAYGEDAFAFSVPEIPNENLLFSIGRADGDPADYDGLFDLIAQADACLYEVKRKTHTAAYGGHDRRKS